MCTRQLAVKIAEIVSFWCSGIPPRLEPLFSRSRHALAVFENHICQLGKHNDGGRFPKTAKEREGADRINSRADDDT